MDFPKFIAGQKGTYFNYPVEWEEEDDEKRMAKLDNGSMAADGHLKEMVITCKN